MSVRIRTKSAPVNRSVLLALGSGALAYWLWPFVGGAWGLGDFYAVMFAAGSFFASATGLSRLVKDYRLRRDLARSMEVTEDHGSAREANAAEIDAMGMYDPASGDLLGLDPDGRPVFRPRKSPFLIYEASPGTGKSVCAVVPSILHRAMAGASLVIADPKCTLAPMLMPSLRKRGFEVWAVNPTGTHIDVCGDTELNPYQPVIDATYAVGAERKNAVKYVDEFSHLHYPETKEEKNPYFGFGSRRVILVGILILAFTDPAHCTPTGVYALLADVQRFLGAVRKFLASFETHIKDDPLVAFVKTECRNVLHAAGKLEENFAAFIEGATQRLLSFSQAGHLGGYGGTAIRRIAELRERQIILFIMAPLSHGRALADFTSLLNHGIIAACKARPNGHPVHIVGEEALNYQFKDLVSDLETMRELGVTADFYIQSFAGLEKRYGRESAQAIESCTDCRLYAGVSSLLRARHVSDMLSETTIRKQDYSYKGEATDLGVSSRELGRRLATPDEILSMKRNQTWAFIRGMKPMRLTMVPYWQVSPWAGWVEPNPITGESPKGEILFDIAYPERSAR